jgi:hypothetical protein
LKKTPYSEKSCDAVPSGQEDVAYLIYGGCSLQITGSSNFPVVYGEALMSIINISAAAYRL